MLYQYYTNSKDFDGWATQEISELESIAPAMPQRQESLACVSSQ
jgi:hypothetical protein